jgi:hypothetical protein
MTTALEVAMVALLVVGVALGLTVLALLLRDLHL